MCGTFVVIFYDGSMCVPLFSTVYKPCVVHMCPMFDPGRGAFASWSQPWEIMSLCFMSLSLDMSLHSLQFCFMFPSIHFSHLHLSVSCVSKSVSDVSMSPSLSYVSMSCPPYFQGSGLVSPGLRVPCLHPSDLHHPVFICPCLHVSGSP